MTDYLTWGDFRWNQNLKNSKILKKLEKLHSWSFEENERPRISVSLTSRPKVLSKIIYQINIFMSWYNSFISDFLLKNDFLSFLKNPCFVWRLDHQASKIDSLKSPIILVREFYLCKIYQIFSQEKFEIFCLKIC